MTFRLLNSIFIFIAVWNVLLAVNYGNYVNGIVAFFSAYIAGLLFRIKDN